LRHVRLRRLDDVKTRRISLSPLGLPVALAITIDNDIIHPVTDILIRDVPADVVAALDANAQRAGVTRAEYLRRVLAEQQGPAVTRNHLERFAERTADLGDPEVMAAAWR
jgi:hypothetical protein